MNLNDAPLDLKVTRNNAFLNLKMAIPVPHNKHTCIRERQTDRETERERDRKRERERQRQTERDRETETQRENTFKSWCERFLTLQARILRTMTKNSRSVEIIVAKEDTRCGTTSHPGTF